MSFALLLLLGLTPQEFADGYKLASTSGLACDAVVKSMKAAQKSALRVDCAKKKVCDAKAACVALEPWPNDTAFAVKTRKDLADALSDRKAGSACEEIKTWFESWHLGDDLRQPFRYECKWRLMCSNGPDGAPGTPDDVCYPMP